MGRAVKIARRVGRWAGYGLVAVAGLLLLAYGGLQTRWAQERVSREVEALVSEAVPGTVRLDLTQLQLWSVVAENVAVEDPEGREVLRIDRVRAVPRWSALVRGVIGLREVAARGVFVRLLPSEESGVSLLDAFIDPNDEETDGPATELAIESIVVESGRVDAELLEGPPVELAEVEVEAALFGAEDIRFELARLAFVATRDGEPLLHTERFAGVFQTGPSARSELQVTLAGPEEQLRLDAELVNPTAEAADAGEGPTMRVALALDPMTPRLLRLFGEDALAEDIPEALHADISLEGRPADLRVAAVVRAEASELRLTGHYLDGGPSVVRLCAPGQATLSHLWGSLPDEDLSGCAEVTVGDVTEPSFAAELAVESLRYAGEAIPDLRLTGRASPAREELHIEGLYIPSLEPEGVERVRLAGRVGFDGAVELRLGLVGMRPGDVPQLAEQLGQVRGVLDADIHLVVTPGEAEEAPTALRVGLDATVRGFRGDGVRVARARVHGDVRGTLAQPRFDLRAEAQGVVSGDLRVAHAELSARGTPELVNLRLRSELREGWDLDVAMHVREQRGRYLAGGRGTLTPAAGSWAFSVQQVAFDPDSGAVAIDRFRLRRGEGSAQLDGTVSGEGRLDLRLGLDRLPLGELTALAADPAEELQGLEASLSGQLAATGTTQLPELEAELALDEVRAPGFDGLDGLSSTLRLTYGRRDAQLHLVVRTPEGTAEVSGHAAWPRPLPPERALERATYDVVAELDGLSLAFLARLAEPEDEEARLDIAGALVGRLRFLGTLDEPELALTLAARPLRLPDLPPIVAAVDATWTDEGLLAEVRTDDPHGPLLSAALRSQTSTRALVSGTLAPLAMPFELHVKLVERNLDALPGEPLPGADLQVAATLALFGEPGRPLRGQLRGSVRGDVSGMGEGIPGCAALGRVDLQVEGELADGRTVLELDGTLKGEPAAHAQLTAATPIDAFLRGEASPDALTADLEARLTNVPLAHLPGGCEYGTGTLSAEIAGQRLASPEATLTAHLTSPALRPHQSEATFSLDARVELGPEQADARAALVSATGGEAEVFATVPFTWGEEGLSPHAPDGPLSATVEIRDLSLEPFATVTPLIARQAGVLEASIRLDGTTRQPLPHGEVRLRESTLIMPGLDQRLTDVTAHVGLEPERIVIHSFRARDLDGVLALDGQVRFAASSLSDAQINLRASRFPVRQAGLIAARITSVAEVTVDQQPDALRGEVRFDSLAVRLPEELPRDLQDLEPNPDIIYVDSYPEGWEPPPEDLDEVVEEVLDDDSPFIPSYFRIRAREPFWVRRPDDLAVQLTADLTIAVEEDGVELTGEVRTLRGYLELLSTNFEISEGSIEFIGGAEVNPRLQITASTNAGTANEVRVTISGFLSNPELTFVNARGDEITAGLAVQCITTGRCEQFGDMAAAAETSGGAADAASQQARSALASVTAGLLTTAARHGLGDQMPRIAITPGDQLAEVTLRAGFEANRLVPEFLRGIVTSMYIEGFVGTEATETADATEGGTRARGGFVIELRHPRSFVTRGRYEPPANWSLDITWQR